MRLPATKLRTHISNHTPVGAATAHDVNMHAWFILLGVIAALLWPVYSSAESQTGTSSARASLDFRIVIPAIVRVKAIAQPDTLQITGSDIARGYIDLEAGSSVTLTTNSPLGYLLTARYDRQLLAAIEVRMSNENMNTNSGIGSMRMASAFAVDKVVPISYRLYLAEGIAPGVYQWPVRLDFSLNNV